MNETIKKMRKFDPLIETVFDEMETPEVRIWSLEKYKLLGHYCHIFTNGMKNKWNQLVYIDLFAGAGNVKIQENNKVYLSSPLIAMSLPIPFSKYILCEKNEKRFDALQKRINSNFSHLNYKLINGDSNCCINEIKKSIPRFNKNNTLLTFCFVDPFSLNLHFETIAKLGEINIDFLILQALHMDGNRNVENYLNINNQKIELYLNKKDWREFYKQEKSSNFVKFLADMYESSMTKIGYKKGKNFHQIRSNLKNLPLFYLSFYSKHNTGINFFKKIKNMANQQFKLDL
jgi:three-Cys-motif partner protein